MPFKKKTLRSRFLLSSLLVLVPIIFITITAYQYNINLNCQLDYTRMMSALTRASERIDTLLSSIDSLVSHSFDPSQCYVKNDQTYLLDTNKMATSLGYLKNGLYFDSEPFCFCTSNNQIYSIDGVMHYNTFEHNILNNMQMRSSNLFTKLQSITKPRLIYFSGINDNNGYLAYLLPMRITLNTRERYVVIFLINDDLVFQEIDDYIGYMPGDFYLYTNDANMIIEKHENSNDILKKNTIFQLKGIGTIKTVPGYIIFREKSEKHSLTYLLAIKEQVFYANTLSESNHLLLLMIIFVVSCVVLLFYISWRNYKPIQSLTMDITGKKSTKMDEDDLALIRNRFDQTNTEKLTLHEQLDEQSKILRNQFCTRLLLGHVKNDNELAHLSRCTGFPVDSRYYAVLYILPANMEIQKSLMEYLSELSFIEKKWLVGETLQEDGICIIMTFDVQDGQEATDALYNLALSMHQNIIKKNGLQEHELHIGVGRWKTSLLSINDSYLESIAVLHNTGDALDKPIYLYEQESGYDHNHTESPNVLLSLLSESIKRGEATVVRHTYEKLIEYIKACPKDIQLLRYSELLITLEKSSHQHNLPMDLQKLSMLLNGSHDLLVKNISAIIEELCDKASNALQRNDEALRSNLMNYIEAHCFDANFSLSCVMDDLHLSKVKINTIMQEDTGMTFSSYVSSLRMDRFCSELIHTDKNIQSIVKEIGYNDVSSFLRKFKSIKGITAGQYREKWRG